MDLNHHLIFEGFLHKQSVYLKKMRKRWMVLKDHFLYSYKEKQVYTHPTEIFDLHSFYIAAVTTEGTHELGQFELISLTETRIFITSSLEEMNNWVGCLNTIISSVNLNSNLYLTRMCSSVLYMNHKQRKGMSIYSKLISSGLNNNDICLIAACKYPNDYGQAMNYVIESLNLDAIVLREHFMEKKSKWIGKWRRRWTVLMFEPYGNICYLATYKKRKQYVAPTEFILMNNKTEIFVMENDKSPRFVIQLNDDANTKFLFKAESMKLRDEWVSLLVSRKNNWTVLNDMSDRYYSIDSGERKSWITY
eukprot:107895_1